MFASCCGSSPDTLRGWSKVASDPLQEWQPVTITRYKVEKDKLEVPEGSIQSGETDGLPALLIRLKEPEGGQAGKSKATRRVIAAEVIDASDEQDWVRVSAQLWKTLGAPNMEKASAEVKRGGALDRIRFDPQIRPYLISTLIVLVAAGWEIVAATQDEGSWAHIVAASVAAAGLLLGLALKLVGRD